MREISIRIGAQTRALCFDLDAVENAERLVGGRELRVVLFTERSKLNVFRLAAAGFSRAKKKISPLDVKAWVREDPTVYPKLERAVMQGVAAHLLECGEISEREALAMGEVLGGSPSGDAAENDSDSPAGAGSPPPNSEG